ALPISWRDIGSAYKHVGFQDNQSPSGHWKCGDIIIEPQWEFRLRFETSLENSCDFAFCEIRLGHSCSILVRNRRALSQGCERGSAGASVAQPGRCVSQQRASASSAECQHSAPQGRGLQPRPRLHTATADHTTSPYTEAALRLRQSIQTTPPPTTSA